MFQIVETVPRLHRHADGHLSHDGPQATRVLAEAPTLDALARELAACLSTEGGTSLARAEAEAVTFEAKPAPGQRRAAVQQDSTESGETVVIRGLCDTIPMTAFDLHSEAPVPTPADAECEPIILEFPGTPTGEKRA